MPSPFGTPPAYMVAPQFANAMYPSGYDPHQAPQPGQFPQQMGQQAQPQYHGPFNFMAGNRPDLAGNVQSGWQDFMAKFPQFGQRGLHPNAGAPMQHEGQPMLPPNGNTGIVPPNMQQPQMQPPQMNPAPRPMQPGGFNFLSGRRPNPLIAR